MSEIKSGLPVLDFADRGAFEAWIARQPADAAGAWIKFAKKGGAATSCSKAEAIDAALCHGWIDGQLAGYDDAHWLIRFTPRKPRSKWSEINRSRALELIASGEMREAGLAQVRAAQADGMPPTRPPAGRKCRPICRPRWTVPRRQRPFSPR